MIVHFLPFLTASWYDQVGPHNCPSCLHDLIITTAFGYANGSLWLSETVLANLVMNIIQGRLPTQLEGRPAPRWGSGTSVIFLSISKVFCRNGGSSPDPPYLESDALPLRYSHEWGDTYFIPWQGLHHTCHVGESQGTLLSSLSQHLFHVHYNNKDYYFIFECYSYFKCFKPNTCMDTI